MLNKTDLERTLDREVTYIPNEFITIEQLAQVELHAHNMNRLLRTQRIDDNTLAKRHEVRDELHRVVMWLYKFNINLTNLLTNDKPITE